MQRTVTIDLSGELFFREKWIGYATSQIRKHFRLNGSCKYRITIVEGTKYHFVRDGAGYLLGSNYCRKIGFICASKFHKLFFEPDTKKRYNITVKMIEG